MNNFQDFYAREQSLIQRLLAVCTALCLCIPANVAHSLPSTRDFNSSLNASLDNPAMASYQVRTVVLDAGHGGKDPGCLGRKTTEKEVALDVVLRLGQMIKQNYPDVKVIYTRSTDEFIPLYKRAEIANKAEADLFISVHANAVKKRSVAGSETFVLGLHRAASNLEVAKRENAAILKEDNHDEHYDGFDPNSDEGHIALSMYQNAFLDQSITLANLIETEFVSHAERKSRGVKQAGFIVLHKTYMPSVLVEVGFLTNSKEENFLVSENGKRKSATSIFNAFSQYKYDIESYGEQLAANQSQANPSQQISIPQVRESAPAPTKDVTAVNEVVQEKVIATKPAKTNSSVIQSGTNKESSKVLSTHVSQTVPSTKAHHKMDRETAPASPTRNTVTTQHPPRPKSTTVRQSSTPASDREKYRVQRGDVKYVVQVAAGAKKLAPKGTKWSSLDDVLIRYENNMYKYQIGEMSSYDQAVQRRSNLRAMGFKDCFIVAYRDGKQVKLKEVVAMTGH